MKKEIFKRNREGFFIHSWILPSFWGDTSSLQVQVYEEAFQKVLFP